MSESERVSSSLAGIAAANMAARSERLIAAVDSAGADLMLVSDLTNVRYLTGFTGSNALVLIGPELRLFVTDSRYTEQALVEVESSYEQRTAAASMLAEVFGRVGAGSHRVAFEDTMSVAEHARLQESVPEGVELVPASGLVERLRQVKDVGEIELIAHAAQIADDALSALLSRGLEGRTERALALELEHDMRLRGAECPSFDTIVASGAHGALPHANPREVAIERGQLVTFDWGARYQGYCSDCTRTVAVGEPSAVAREAYEMVLGAQIKGVEAVRVGASGRDLDALVRDVIDAAGHAEHFGHGLGHGVGLEIHEAPNLSRRSTDTLAIGEVVTVEPGVYVPGEFGLRIEDQLVLGDGQNLLLTKLPKQLLLVD